MNIEDIDKYLDYPTITVAPSDLEPDTFDRNRYFNVEGVTYRIEWWKNISYLYHGALQIPFDRMERANTWPNRSMMNLQFYYNNNVCCVLKIESNPEEQS